MRWLGMTAGILTLAAVVLNTMWFARHADIPAGKLWRFSGPTIFYLLLFLGGVFAFGWLSARAMVKLDPREKGGEGAEGTRDGSGEDSGGGRGGDEGDAS